MAKSKAIIVVNSGACAIFFDGALRLPGEEFEISKEVLETDAFEYLIFRGEIVVKDDSATTEAVKAKAAQRKKKDPTEGKTKAQLEDGGEF